MKKKMFVVKDDFSLKEVKLEKPKILKDESLFALDYINIGWYIIIPILLFLGLGILVKKYLIDSSWIIVLFLFVGVGSSFYNVFKLIKWRR